MSDDPDFVCVVCERLIDMRWNFGWRGRDKSIPPVCQSCEYNYTVGVGKPRGGSLMDRRQAVRVCALAEALRVAAQQITWSQKYGRA